MSIDSRLKVKSEKNFQGEQVFFCPFCESRRGTADMTGHLYVNERKGKFICHRCEIRGTIAYLQKLLGFEHGALDEDTWREKLQAALDAPQKPQAIVRGLPRDFAKLPAGSEAYRYLLGRGLSPEDMEYFHVGIGTADLRDIAEEERRFYAGKGRVVFPDYDREGNLTYWVARTYKDPPHKAKYKNAWWPARDEVFHLARVPGPYVVIGEGPLDAMVASRWTGRNAVATYGKGVSEEQVIRLAQELPKVHTYYVALDPDAPREANSLASRLAHRYLHVRLVQMPEGQDPASLGPSFCTYLAKSLPFSFL